MEQHFLKINGMGSEHCVGVVKRLIENVDGASIEAIRLGSADITIDQTKTSKENIIASIEKLGYKVER